MRHDFDNASPVEVEEEEEEEDSNISGHLVHSQSDVDPKKVLEQNGINISEQASGATAGGDGETKTQGSASDTISSNQLAMEIDSLGAFPSEDVASSASIVSTSAQPTTTTEVVSRTRLPSFSSIIGGSPKQVTFVLLCCHVYVPL